MNRASILAIVLTALAAGFLGSVVKDSVFEARVVDAQPGPTPTMKVALLDLESVARASKLFKQLKQQWELRQNELKEENRKMAQEMEEKQAALRRAQSRTDSAEEISSLRVELTAMEENIKTTKEVQKRFLTELLENYQKQVIVDVMAKANQYCTREGYHLVLQNYDTDSTDTGDMFAGGSYSERIMNKPVLFAPGITAKKNPYVVDITAQMVEIVKGE